MRIPTSQILRETRDRIATPDTWLQGSSRNFMRTKFCSTGSLLETLRHKALYLNYTSVETNLTCEDAMSYLLQVIRPMKYYSIPVFNDVVTHARVMLMFDQAIALAEEDERKTEEFVEAAVPAEFSAPAKELVTA